MNDLTKTLQEYVDHCKEESKKVAADKKDARQSVNPTFEGLLEYLGVKGLEAVNVPVATKGAAPSVYDDEEFWHDGKQVSAKEYGKLTGVKVLPASERPEPSTEDDTQAEQ